MPPPQQSHAPVKARGHTLPTEQTACIAAGVPSSATALGLSANMASEATRLRASVTTDEDPDLDPDPAAALPDLSWMLEVWFRSRPAMAKGAHLAVLALPVPQIETSSGMRRAMSSVLCVWPEGHHVNEFSHKVQPETPNTWHGRRSFTYAEDPSEALPRKSSNKCNCTPPLAAHIHQH